MRIFDTSKTRFSNTDLKKEIILPEKLTFELAEETGLHIGDGSMNFYLHNRSYKGIYSLRGHILDDKKHYNLRIKNLYLKLYNFKPSLRSMKSTGVYGFQIWTDCVVDFKHKILGLPLGYKTNVRIPDCFLNNKKYYPDIIRGIFDTDGCVYLEHRNKRLYPRIQVGTISAILAEQMRKILLYLGFRVTKFMENRVNKGWSNFYVISVRGDDMFKKWMEIIKPANPKHIKKFNFYINNS